jgi:hypothetical protein
MNPMFWVLLLLALVVQASAQEKKSDRNFQLRPAKGGGQTGLLDAEGMPTAIKINDEWVYPRKGAVEWLMSKGYVPHPEHKNIMIPNLSDKRYKKPGPKYMPSLATTPIDYIYIPKAKRSNVPFPELADPTKKKYSPTPGFGANLGLLQENPPLGPVLEPNPPDLGPFGNPEKPKVAPLKANKRLQANDPFADSLINPNPDTLNRNKNQLPGKVITIPNE